jgi:parvulin-like peptidyl-prolyl isomerase
VKRSDTITGVLFALVSLAMVLSCTRVREERAGPPASSVVLRVADNELTLGEVDDYFHRSYYDDIETEWRKKKEYVEQMLEFYMLARAAIEAGFEAEIDSGLYYETLLRELKQIEVTEKIHFTDDDVKEYFEKYGGETQAGHILVADSALAESLYNVIQEGGDYDELAREFSMDPVSKDRGGSLGYMELNYYDVEFMKVACSLEPGQVARPYQSVRGWHIIKLYDRIKDTPDRLESRYRKYRNKTYNLFERKRLREFKKEIMAAHDYRIDKETINMMITRADSVRSTGEMPPDLPLSSYLSSDLFTEDEKERYMLEFDGRGYTVGQYVEYVEATDPARTPNLSNSLIMEDFFERGVLTPLIIQDAVKMGIDTLETFKKRIENAEATQLVEELKAELMKNLPEITDEDVERYYNEHQSDYYTSDNMHVFAIGAKDRELAVELIDRINAGAVFEQLAEKYSVDRKSGAKGGDLGYFAKERYPELFEAADGMKEGEIGGPVEMYGSWWVFRLVDRRPVELRPLNRARAGIIPEIRRQNEQALVDSVVSVQKTMTDYSLDLNPIREELGLAPNEDFDESAGGEG